MLCSPSCSASLSERFAPLRVVRKHNIVDQAAYKTKRPLTLRIKSIVPSQEPYFISSSLISSNLFMLGNLSCISFLTPRLMPTGTTFRLLQVGNTIAWVSVTFYRWTTEIWTFCGGPSVRLLWTYITEQSSHNLSSSEPNRCSIWTFHTSGKNVNSNESDLFGLSLALHLCTLSSKSSCNQRALL